MPTNIYNEKIYGFRIPSGLKITSKMVVEAVKTTRTWVYTQNRYSQSSLNIIYLKKATKLIVEGTYFTIYYDYSEDYPINNSDIEKPMITKNELNELNLIKSALGITTDVIMEWFDFHREE